MLALLTALALSDPATCAATPGLSHYDVDVRVDPAAGSLSAEATVTLAPDDVRPEQTFILGGTYEITSATSEDAAIELSPAGARTHRITVRPNTQGAGNPIHFTVRYAGPLRETGEPPLNAVSPERVELNLDGGWAPIRSDYTLRFSSCLDIEGLPEGLNVVSQGVVTQIGTTASIARATPDFDLAFVAAPNLNRAAGEGFELYAAQPDAEIEGHYRRHGARALAFLEDWFGPIAGRPVRVVMVDRPRGSGYARLGYVVVTRGRGGDEESIGKFIAHEFAHAWSPAADPTTEHHWLIESTAEYVALRYVEAAFGVAARDARLAEKRTLAADAAPILGGGRRNDAVLYAKGALRLFDLEARLGRPTMDVLMRDFARGRPATTPAFMDLLARHADAATVAAFADSLRT